MRGPSAAGGLIVLLVACGPERSHLSLPSLEGVEAIALLSSDRSEVSLAPYPDAGAITFQLDGDSQGGSFFLMGFPCDVARLTRDSAPVKRPTELYSSPYGSDESPTWQKESNVPEWVGARLRWPLQEARPCRSFSRRIVALNPAARIISIVPLDASRVLITTKRGFFIFDGHVLLPVEGLSPDIPTQAFLGDDGEVWLADGSGELARGHPDRGFERLPFERWIPMRGGDVRLAVSASGDLFAALRATNELGARVFAYWYHDDRWQTLIDGENEIAKGPPALAMLGPGRAVLSIGSRPGVTRLEEGRLTSESFPLVTRPIVFAEHPTLGLVAGTSNGALLARQPAGWVVLREPPLNLTDEIIRTLAPLGPGLAYVEVHERFEQWFAEDARCATPGLSVQYGDRFTRMAALGDSFVLNSTIDRGELEPFDEIHVLEPVPLPDACTVDDGWRGEGWREAGP